MGFLNLFQNIREYSQFQWMDRLFFMMNHRPKFYLLSLWTLFFLYDQLISIFHPYTYPFFFTLLNFLLGTPFILYLFFFYLPAIRLRAEIGFLSLKLIELSVFLTVTKYILLGYKDLSFADKDNYLLLEEILRLQEFAFFALLWWGIRELVRAFQKNILVTLDLYKAQADLEHVSLSPHFLFNALNNIAGRSAVFSDKLFHLITDFSSLLQQAYKSPDDPHFMPDEIAIINNMLSLAEGGSDRLCLHLHVEYDRPLECLRIPKLILGTLMENMIKYGIIDDAANPAEMLITIQTGEDGNTRLICTTWNLVHPIKASFSSGRGLSALRRILRGEVGIESTFEWNQNQNTFKTLMMINYGYIKTGAY